MKLFQEYEKNKKEIFEYFGYVEDWRIIPLDFCCEFFWHIEVENRINGSVIFAESKDALLDTHKGDYYCSELFRRRQLPNPVFRGKDYTMIVADTEVDENQVLHVFDNSKEVGSQNEYP